MLNGLASCVEKLDRHGLTRCANDLVEHKLGATDEILPTQRKTKDTQRKKCREKDTQSIHTHSKAVSYFLFLVHDRLAPVVEELSAQ